MKLEEIKGNANDGLFRAESGIIYFRKFRTGKGEIFRSTKSKDLALARRIRDQLMAELWGDKPKVQRRQTVGELWPMWYEGKRSTKAKATSDSVRTTWRNLEAFIADKFPDEVTEDWWVTEYIPRRRAEPGITGRVNPDYKFMNDRKWLTSFLRYLKRRGLLQEAPRLINPDPPRDRAETFSDSQFGSMLERADWSLMAKLVMGRDHFMRRSEVAFLEKAWVDREKRVISLPAHVTKIRKARSFPYSETLECLFRILDYEAARAGVTSRFVFASPISPEQSIGRTGFNRAWTTCKRNAGVPARMKFHWLRHTGLSIATKRPGVNLVALAIAAGVSLEEMQKTYLHYSIDDLRGVENLVGGL